MRKVSGLSEPLAVGKPRRGGVEASRQKEEGCPVA